MRVVREDSQDLGIALTALTVGAVDREDISGWASRVIDRVDDPPLYIYTMLDLTGEAGRELRAEIGFTPSSGIETEEEYQYLREIGVRRGLETIDYLGGKPRTSLPAARKAFIDKILQRNFGFRPDDLPPLQPMG